MHERYLNSLGFGPHHHSSNTGVNLVEHFILINVYNTIYKTVSTDHVYVSYEIHHNNTCNIGENVH